MVWALAPNEAAVDPAATVTEEGTLKSGVLVARATVRPPAGAVPVSATVQVLIPPVERVTGLHCIEDNAGALTLSLALDELPAYDAVIVISLVLATGTVVTLKTADMAPSVTVMLAGVAATPGFELARVTTAPLEGAGVLNLTVFPVIVTPPVTTPLLSANPEMFRAQAKALAPPPNSYAPISTPVPAGTRDCPQAGSRY